MLRPSASDTNRGLSVFRGRTRGKRRAGSPADARVLPCRSQFCVSRTIAPGPIWDPRARGACNRWAQRPLPADYPQRKETVPRVARERERRCPDGKSNPPFPGPPLLRTDSTSVFQGLPQIQGRQTQFHFRCTRYARLAISAASPGFRIRTQNRQPDNDGEGENSPEEEGIPAHANLLKTCLWRVVTYLDGWERGTVPTDRIGPAARFLGVPRLQGTPLSL